MFDIGFSEIVVIGVVALVVIGPERLPKVARVTGRMLGQFQRYVNSVKAEIDREMQLEELKKLQGEVNDAARGLEQSMREGVAKVETEARQIETEVAATAGSATAAVEEAKHEVASAGAQAKATLDSAAAPAAASATTSANATPPAAS